MIHFTHWVYLDPIVALVIALYVFWVGIEQIKKCVAELSDSTLPETEIASIKGVLLRHKTEFLNYHDLRTRKAGAMRYIELHLEVCSDQSVHEAHAVCDTIEADLTQCFKEVDVNIHVEPCGNHSMECTKTCQFYNAPRKQVGKNV